MNVTKNQQTLKCNCYVICL